jgi:Rrf2 family transcriptional regulator, cysteine metabolism repressor
MAQLAKYHDGRTLTRLEDLAQHEAVSANFLVQILNDLRRAGLIESRRGKAGGYLLARPADQITLRQVVEAVDSMLLQCSVTREGDSGQAVRRAWEQVSLSLTTALDHITIASLIATKADPMFYI